MFGIGKHGGKLLERDEHFFDGFNGKLNSKPTKKYEMVESNPIDVVDRYVVVKLKDGSLKKVNFHKVYQHRKELEHKFGRRVDYKEMGVVKFL